MTFWQSPEWMERVDSIYSLDPSRGDPDFMPWWKEAWKLYRRRDEYDVVLTMGIRESFAYAFLCRMSGRPSRQIMTEIFIDPPRMNSVFWHLKTFFYRKLARHAIGVITNSTAEIETNARRFDLPPDRFRYVPLTTTIAEPEFDPRPDGYLFCAGRTLRDYTTLVAVMSETDQPWQVVGGTGDLVGIALPDRVTVHREIDRQAYLKLLRGARVVVLPLLPTERSTGQVVLLEAMSYGKPVITTRAPGTIDIVRHGENGFLVEPGDSSEIKNILAILMSKPEEEARIGQQALKDIQEKHTVHNHTLLRLNAVKELWEKAYR